MIFIWAAFRDRPGSGGDAQPRTDRLEQELTFAFFVPAYGFCAMLIGYGIAVTAFMVSRTCRNARPAFLRAGCVSLLALPLITYLPNRDGCSRETDDFGYQFGYRMFRPGGGYPDMEKGAVLYGGTDPGRFVPTYMIFCESRVAPKDRFRNHDFDRSDVYIITQNALADNTYMSYIRDHYDFRGPNLTTPRLSRSFDPWHP